MAEVISVIGAGGKTSLVHRLAEQYRQDNKKVLVTTTTHMLLEEDTDTSCDVISICEKLQNVGYCMAGTLCDTQPVKIKTLPIEVLRDIMSACDICLIEADGAKHHALKFPAEHEPVILPETTKVILVMGTWVIGESCEKVIFRYPLMEQYYSEKKMLEELPFVSADTPVSQEIIDKILVRAYLDKLKKLGYTGEVQVVYNAI